MGGYRKGFWGSEGFRREFGGIFEASGGDVGGFLGNSGLDFGWDFWVIRREFWVILMGDFGGILGVQ